MAITSTPQVLSQSVDAFINAGNTSRVQSFTGSTSAVSINPTNGVFSRIISPSGAVTVSFTGVPSGYANQWFVEVNNKLAQTVTFSGVTWDGGSAPTITSTASKMTLLSFYSPDGGTTIYGKAVIANA